MHINALQEYKPPQGLWRFADAEGTFFSFAAITQHLEDLSYSAEAHKGVLDALGEVSRKLFIMLPATYAAFNKLGYYKKESDTSVVVHVTMKSAELAAFFEVQLTPNDHIFPGQVISVGPVEMKTIEPVWTDA